MKAIYTGRAADKSMIGKIFITSFLGALLLAPVPSSGDRAPVIPGAKETFAVSPSPWEDRVLLYALKKNVQGETAAYVPGSLYTLSKSGNSWSVREMKTIAADMDSGKIVWAKGNAYATSSSGIFLLRPSAAPRKIYSGKATGLAVSKDGVYLAFWQSPKKGDTLTVVRASNGHVVRRWTRPYHLPTESSGWEMVFTPDGKSILARTYDEEEDTHLKSFNLHTGSITTLLEGCNSVVQSGDAIFVFGGQGESKGLYEFAGGQLQLLMHIDEEDSLTPTAHDSLVVVTNTFDKHLLIYDVANHSSQAVKGCEDATVLKSGQQIFFLHGKIFPGSAGCPNPN